MGQRTQIILRKIYEDGRKETTAYHYQWGYGRVMPSVYMSLLHSIFTYRGIDAEPIQECRDSWTSEALNNLELLDGEAVGDFVRNEMDNNNGAIIIVLKEIPGGVDIFDGYIMGSEDIEGEWVDEYDKEKDVTRYIFKPYSGAKGGYVDWRYFLQHNGGARFSGEEKYMKMMEATRDYFDVQSIYWNGQKL